MRDPAMLEPEIRAYLEAENAYCEAQLSETNTPCRRTLFHEMNGRLKEHHSSVPAADGAYAYYIQLCCRRAVSAASAASARSGDGSKRSCSTATSRLRASATGTSAAPQHSPDHASSPTKRRQGLQALHHPHPGCNERVHDLPDSIPDTRGGIVWANDSRTLFYVRLDEQPPPAARLPPRSRHAGGGRRARLRGEGHRLLRRISARRSPPSSSSSTRTTTRRARLYLIDADAPMSAPRVVEPRSTAMSIRSSTTATD